MQQAQQPRNCLPTSCTWREVSSQTAPASTGWEAYRLCMPGPQQSHPLAQITQHRLSSTSQGFAFNSKEVQCLGRRHPQEGSFQECSADTRGRKPDYLLAFTMLQLSSTSKGNPTAAAPAGPPAAHPQPKGRAPVLEAEGSGTGTRVWSGLISSFTSFHGKKWFCTEL